MAIRQLLVQLFPEPIYFRRGDFCVADEVHEQFGSVAGEHLIEERLACIGLGSSECRGEIPGTRPDPVLTAASSPKRLRTRSLLPLQAENHNRVPAAGADV